MPIPPRLFRGVFKESRGGTRWFHSFLSPKSPFWSFILTQKLTSIPDIRWILLLSVHQTSSRTPPCRPLLKMWGQRITLSLFTGELGLEKLTLFRPPETRF